ncbi:MAG TPA: DUF3817 domain-containing protein [Crocinitomicaceae bacterium]|nr:DUF3817 domain-containing protein [Crocinitomicaceae bacterium]
MKEQTLLKTLRFVAILEAISWLALLVAMYFKWVLKDETYMRTVGNIHGYIFITFVVLVLVVGRKMKWKASEIIWSLLSSFPPCTTIIADLKIFKKYAK